MFALVDCNNFYASCERVFRPDLKGKPIVVLSNNDGCVIARSNEAKVLGVPMGAPAFKFKSLFEQKHIHVFSSNFALYGDMSGRVMSLLSAMAPEIEIYSIDEAFLRYERCDYLNIPDYAAEMRRTVSKSTGIPVSVSFAPTKVLAKVANRIAKKFPERTGGVYIMDSEEKRVKALKWLKIEDVWGIGRRHSARLQQYGITTAYQFTQQTDGWIRQQMSVVGLRLKHELLGHPMLPIDEKKNKKSIATTRSFEKRYTELSDLRERVVTFAVTCAGKLRKQKSNCSSLMVFLQTDSHREDLPQSMHNMVIKLPYATNSSLEISRFANQALSRIYRKGYAYKKAGVVVMDINPACDYQLNIFENSNPKHKPLMKAIDELNRRIGHDKVKLASQDQNRTWKMRQEHLSPCYTTRLNDIITVKV